MALVKTYCYVASCQQQYYTAAHFKQQYWWTCWTFYNCVFYTLCFTDNSDLHYLKVSVLATVLHHWVVAFWHLQTKCHPVTHMQTSATLLQKPKITLFFINFSLLWWHSSVRIVTTLQAGWSSIWFPAEVHDYCLFQHAQSVSGALWWVPRFFSQYKAARRYDVDLSPPVQRLRMNGAIPYSPSIISLYGDGQL